MSQTQIFEIAHLSDEDLRAAAAAIKQGAVAVLPTDTVYGLAASAFCEEAIERIYQIKNRPLRQPLQILLKDAAQAHLIARFSLPAERLAKAYWPGALTLILPPTVEGKKLLRGSAGLGIRVPNMPFLNRFFDQFDGPLACTSANEHGQPVLTREEDLLELLSGKVDFIFKGGTLSPVASSVVDVTQAPRLLREGAISKVDLEQAALVSILQ